jgi:hypothetical protein
VMLAPVREYVDIDCRADGVRLSAAPPLLRTCSTLSPVVFVLVAGKWKMTSWRYEACIGP